MNILGTIVITILLSWIAYIAVFAIALLIAMVKGDDERVENMLKWALLHG